MIYSAILSIDIGTAAFVVASAVASPVVLLASAPQVEAVASAIALGEALTSSHTLGLGSRPDRHHLLHVHLVRLQEGCQGGRKLISTVQGVQYSCFAPQPVRKIMRSVYMLG